MALRVLLADESTTIQKVIELALQDYGVEVKSVNVGTDVVPIAKNYKPDIIFVDILLPKKNGYQVCAEIKAEAELVNTPLILLWSGFMTVDESQLKDCAPQGRLEKPFETDQLREMVQNHVDGLKSNPISDHIDLPDIPVYAPTPPSAKPPAAAPQTPPPSSPPEGEELEVISLDETWAGPIPTETPETIEEPDLLADIEVTSEELQMDSLEGISDEFSKVDLSDIKKSGGQETPEGLEGLEIDAADDLDDFSSADLNEIQLDSETPEGMEIEMPAAEPTSASDDDVFEIDMPEENSFSAPVEASAIDESEHEALEEPSVPAEEAGHLDDFTIDEFKLDDLAVETIDLDADLDGEIDDAVFMLSDDDEAASSAEDLAARETQTEKTPLPTANSPEVQKAVKEHLTDSIEYARIEEIVREQMTPIIESIVWKVLPEIAEKLVKKELDRLLENVEKDFEGHV